MPADGRSDTTKAPRGPRKPRPWRPSGTQLAILCNVRDHGETSGSHGYPHGMSQSGGWSQSVGALVQRGLIDSELGPWVELAGSSTRRRYWKLTPAGIEFMTSIDAYDPDLMGGE